MFCITLSSFVLALASSLVMSDFPLKEDDLDRRTAVSLSYNGGHRNLKRSTASIGEGKLRFPP